MDDINQMLSQCNGPQQPILLTQPFPQQQQMVVAAPIPPQGGNQANPLQGGNPPISNIFGLAHEVNIQTRFHSYDTPPSVSNSLGSKSTGSPTIEKLTIYIVPRPQKWVLSKSKHNPNARVAQSYNIVEDLAQEPYAKLDLEVLQIFPTQQKSPLFSIFSIDPHDTSLITFDLG